MTEAPGQADAQVPVALFVHRRYELLPRTLECLRTSGIGKLYVFSDGPRHAADEAGVAKVRDLIASIDWTDPVLVARRENLGLSNSIRAGLDELFASHEAAVIVEDDICVAPEFYDYACRALRRYRHEPRVAGITGCRMPFRTTAFDTYPFDVFLSQRFSSWGWATWRDRWQGFSFDLHALRSEMAAATDFRPARAGYDVPGLIHDAVVAERLDGAWDVVCNTNMLLRGQYFVNPCWNMVENTGFEDGTHFTGPPPWRLEWERDRRPVGEIRFAPVQESEAILRDYLRFSRPTRVQLVRGLAGAVKVRLTGLFGR
jgi:hypothetical protein